MDLHGLASGLVSVVNPPIGGTLKASNGTYSTAPDGKRTPNYDTSRVQLQAQDLNQRDLRQLDALNVQNSQRVFYMFGEASAISRVHRKGGDLITLDDDGSVWLVTAVLEQWPDWVKVSVTEQMG